MFLHNFYSIISRIPQLFYLLFKFCQNLPNSRLSSDGPLRAPLDGPPGTSPSALEAVCVRISSQWRPAWRRFPHTSFDVLVIPRLEIRNQVQDEVMNHSLLLFLDFFQKFFVEITLYNAGGGPMSGGFPPRRARCFQKKSGFYKVLKTP